MKPILNNAKSLLVAIVTFLTTTVNAQSNGGSPFNNVSGLNFAVPYVQIDGTGNAIGAKFKFAGVANNTDAIVTVVTATGGATLDVVDDNALTKPEAFSPRIMLMDGQTGLVTFKIELVKSINNNQPRPMNNMALTAFDIDGAKDSSGNFLIREMDYICLGSGANVMYQTAGNLGISVAPSDSGFMAQNIEGIEYPSVDTTAKNVMFTVTKNNVHTFYYKAGGYINAGSNISRQKALYFKGFAYTEAVLSVNYAAFNAVANGNTINLNWATTDEVSNSHFIIERSFDGVNFTMVATINKNEARNYNTTDVITDGKQIVYYRLKQVDVNGTYTYSKTLAVRLQMANTSFEVSPNPFVEKLIVRYNATQKASTTLRIVNLQGAQVVTKNQVVNKGLNNIQVDGLYSLPSGTYVAMLIVDGKVVSTQKIVK
jgi:Secretion system C-terminal sorting domain